MKKKIFFLADSSVDLRFAYDSLKKKYDITWVYYHKKLKLDCGQTINNFPIAYETYGSLNKKKDNAILIFHALTGDQFVTGLNPITNKDGWWSFAVGPNKSIDTNNYFIKLILVN